MRGTMPVDQSDWLHQLNWMWMAWNAGSDSWGGFFFRHLEKKYIMRSYLLLVLQNTWRIPTMLRWPKSRRRWTGRKGVDYNRQSQGYRGKCLFIIIIFQILSKYSQYSGPGVNEATGVYPAISFCKYPRKLLKFGSRSPVSILGYILFYSHIYFF